MYRDTNQREFPRAQRNQPTDAEKRLWHFLRAQKLRGRKFRRQTGAPSAADGPARTSPISFASPTNSSSSSMARNTWTRQAIEHDKQRTNWLAAHGLRIIRFRNQQLD